MNGLKNMIDIRKERASRLTYPGGYYYRDNNEPTPKLLKILKAIEEDTSDEHNF